MSPASTTYPLYVRAFQDGTLASRAEQLWQMLASCQLCPRRCQVNRLKGEEGFCRTGLHARVYSWQLHHGEEPPISGSCGSGTIFFSGCNMACVYCQNHQFSQQAHGKEMTPETLAQRMCALAESGAHNINLVTPTHVLPQILKALVHAVGQGLTIPLVYNTSGYELPEIIRLLAGIVDVFLPDMRYADSVYSLKYSGAPEYPRFNQASVKEMHRQVGIPVCDRKGVIRRGVIIRHLVLPQGASGTEAIMRFIANELSLESYLSLMSQYHPYYRAHEFPPLARPITAKEYHEAEKIMRSHGLHNGWTQEGGLSHLAGIYLKEGR